MFEKKNARDEKMTAEEATEIEIMELDDLDLAGVTGGNASPANDTNGRNCTSNTRCGSRPMTTQPR